MKKIKREAFYQAAADWRYDVYHSQAVWLRYSLIGNIGLLLCLLLTLITQVCLIPLKQKIPY